MQCQLSIVLLVVVSRQCGSQGGKKVDGVWGPWTYDADIDCCAFGGDQRHKRVCDNPLPQNGGKKCVADGKQVLVDYQWTTCDCG